VAPLKNQRRELFAQALARGNTTDDAYAEAGFSPNRGNAARLKANEDILARVSELQEKAERRLFLSKQYVIDALIENIQKALGRKPVRIGNFDKAEDVYVYEGAVANAAIRMAGTEMGMFTERKDVRIANEYSHLSDKELAEKLVEIGQQVLLGGPVIEHDGIDLIGGSPSVSPEPRRRSRNL
jgi:phage terminase small subunit